MQIEPSNQRLFQKGQHYVLLNKEGKAVQFRLDSKNDVQVEELLEDVDFKATGDGLRADGWKCVGPGIEYEELLK
jgi:hypothetical protein